MKKHILIFSILFFTRLSVGFTQNVKWVRVEKIKASKILSYVGEDDQNAFLIASPHLIKRGADHVKYLGYLRSGGNIDNKLIRYDKTYKMTGEFPFVFKHHLDYFYDAYVYNKQVYLLYSSYDKKTKVNGCYADIYDTNGMFVKTEILLETDKEVEYNVIFSENKKYFSIITETAAPRAKDKINIVGYKTKSRYNFGEGDIKTFGSQLKKMSDIKFKKEFTSASAQVSDEGALFYLDSLNGKCNIVRQDSEKSLKAEVTERVSRVQDFAIKVFNEEKKVALISMDAISVDKVATSLFSAKDLGLIYKTSFPIEKSIIVSVLAGSGNVPTEKSPGIILLHFAEAHLSPSNELFLVFQQFHTQSLVVEKSKNPLNNPDDRKLNEHQHLEQYDYIVLVKANEKGSMKQTYVERFTRSEAGYFECLSVKSMFENGKLSLFYNEGHQIYELFHKEFDKDLKEIQTEMESTYKIRGVYLLVKNIIKKGPKTYLGWARYQTKVTPVIFEF